jgi:tetratricopeptide (TPR) repeat protein
MGTLLFGFASVSTAEDRAQILIVHQQTKVEFEGSSVDYVGQDRLDHGTIVVGLRKNQPDRSTASRWFVQTEAPDQKRGWVSANDVTPLSNYANELKAYAIASRVNEENKLAALPDLIRLQSNPAIRKAWERVADVMTENEMLSAEERLPEPYFARAEIWSAVKNYHASLQDYLTGIKQARRLGRDVGSYSPYFDKLAVIIKELSANPVQATGSAAPWYEKARKHFSLGFSDYFSGRYKKALEHFSNCVSLAPHDAHYWYFRALTYRALGEPARARHDALLGAHFEKGSYSDQRLMNIRLSRVQGQSRSWLERYRDGMVTFHLVGANSE